MREVHDSLDRMFDFDHDGRMHSAEEALKCEYLDRMSRTNGTGYDDEDEEDDKDEDGEDDDFESDDFDYPDYEIVFDTYLGNKERDFSQKRSFFTLLGRWAGGSGW